MKLGLGLYRHMLTTDNFRFAKQAGATHIVAHLVERPRNLEILGVDRDEPDACVECETEDQQDHDQAEEGHAALTMFHVRDSVLRQWIALPMRFHSGAFGRFQLSQMRTALPTTLPVGTKPTSGNRLSRLLSRLSPMKK